MPNCFQLTKKGESEPSKLEEIDNELWLKFEGSIPEPNDRWWANWYNIVGLPLACGKSFNEIALEAEGELLEAINYLDKNYEVRSWYSHR